MKLRPSFFSFALVMLSVRVAYSRPRWLAKPVSLFINTFESEKVPMKQIYESVEYNFDLTPDGIIKSLSLLEPIYTKTTNYGHFGRETEGFLWESSIKLVYN